MSGSFGISTVRFIPRSRKVSALSAPCSPEKAEAVGAVGLACRRGCDDASKRGNGPLGAPFQIRLTDGLQPRRITGIISLGGAWRKQGRGLPTSWTWPGPPFGPRRGDVEMPQSGKHWKIILGRSDSSFARVNGLGACGGDQPRARRGGRSTPGRGPGGKPSLGGRFPESIWQRPLLQGGRSVSGRYPF